jgi:hypothetical protein
MNGFQMSKEILKLDLKVKYFGFSYFLMIPPRQSCRFGPNRKAQYLAVLPTQTEVPINYVMCLKSSSDDLGVIT